MSGTVLVINSGSSSIKYQLLHPRTGVSVAHGLVEKIDEDAGHVSHTFAGQTTERFEMLRDHAAGLREVLNMFATVGPDLAHARVLAVGHRVVQGGEYFAGPVVVDDEVMATIAHLSPLAPLHNPANLSGIEVGREMLDTVPHVAVFDTAFFHHLPEAAATYALNREVARAHKIRRYGFHGTSHQYVSRMTAQSLGRDVTDLKQIILHLGNGASASAVDGGRAVETSMGLTPLEGLVMGTRTGDIDPAVIFHLRRTADFRVDELDDLLNRRSGLKGFTGHNDLREVHRLIEEGDPEAQLALDVYLHRLRKYIGAYAAVLGGLDVLTFTAGCGENDQIVRAGAVAGLEFLGISVDPARNIGSLREPTIISPDDSPVTVMVVPTNEELEIARQAASLL